MGDGKTTIGQFDREDAARWVAREAEGARPAVFFGLNHVLELAQSSPQGGRLFPRLPDEEKRCAEARRLVDELHRQAVVLSATMTRPQRWQISAALQDDGTGVRNQYPFIVIPPTDLSDEPVDPRDYVGALQRHAESSHRLMIDATQRHADRDAATIAELRVFLAQAQTHNLDLHRELQRALDEKAKRDVFVKKEEFAIHAKTEVFNLAVQWIGSKMIEQGGGPKVEVRADDMARFLTGLTAYQLEQMAPLLPVLRAHMSTDEMKRLAEIVRPPGGQEST